MSEVVKFESGGDFVPKKEPGDAGFDLEAAEGFTVKAGERKLVRLGLKVAIPQGFYGRLAPRSGLALKHGIVVMAGVIDASFRGELCVILYNSQIVNPQIQGELEFPDCFAPGSATFSKGSRVCQLIIERCEDAKFERVENLEGSTRGEKGFGSSGL
jgi:dUTP pyrophosphatase